MNLKITLDCSATKMENTVETVFNFETHSIDQIDQILARGLGGSGSSGMGARRVTISPDVLQKYKIPELKRIAQKNRLHVSGTKPILINRIITYYEKNRCATIIQKHVRRWFVRLWTSAKGGCAASATPINDADFYTFEPIAEIPYRYYFSYQGSGAAAAVFGFRIQSFIHLIYKSMMGGGSTVVLNPYNREPIPEKTIQDALRFVRLYNILFGTRAELFEDGCESLYDVIFAKSAGGVSAAAALTLQDAIIRQSIIKRLDEMRTKSLDQRVINLFMDIDLLGNYTSYTWFTNLSLRNTAEYWGLLYDIWMYRAGILNETKKRICPFHDPFHRKILRNATTAEEVVGHCLYAMENLVYMSPEEEYRKLGAMYVLCALTIVSSEARRALPWLADIVAW